MFRRCYAGLRAARWFALTVLLGTTLATGTSCSEATASALLDGARTAASSLLNIFFDNIAEQNTFTPVTVKPLT